MPLDVSDGEIRDAQVLAVKGAVPAAEARRPLWSVPPSTGRDRFGDRAVVSASITGQVQSWRTIRAANRRPDDRCDRAGDRARRSLSEASPAGNHRRRGIEMSPIRSCASTVVRNKGAASAIGRRRALLWATEQRRKAYQPGRTLPTHRGTAGPTAADRPD